MTAFQNLSFELNDFGDIGDADGWGHTVQGTAIDSPVFGSTLAPFESFELGWDNNAFLFTINLLTDAARPSLTTLSVVSKFTEDFEELWDSNQDYLWDIGTPTAAPLVADGFESGWGNDAALLAPFGVLGDAIETVPGPLDTFESGWGNDAFSADPFDLVSIAGLERPALATGFKDMEDFETVQAPIPFTVYDAGAGLLHSDPAPSADELIAFVLGDLGNLPPPLVPDLDYAATDVNPELGRWGVGSALTGPMVGLHFWRRSRLLYWDQIATTF